MGEGHESGNGYARIFEKTFGDDLVHRYRRAEYAGTHHGNVKRLQHALNASVFTVRTVQYGKYDVDLDTIAAGKQREAGVVRIQDKAKRFAAVYFPLHAHREEPLTASADANGHYLKLAFIEELIDVQIGRASCRGRRKS